MCYFNPVSYTHLDIGYQGYTCIEVEDKAFENSLEDAKKAVILSAKYLRNYVI